MYNIWKDAVRLIAMATVRNNSKNRLMSKFLVKADALSPDIWWDYDDLLRVKIMPKNTLCRSMYDILNKQELDALKFITNNRSEQCDICGSIAAHKKMDEWWFFDEDVAQQILVRTLSMCDLCYKCARYWGNKTEEWDLNQHFMHVNNWNSVELKDYLFDTNKNARIAINKFSWGVDLSWLDSVIDLSEDTRRVIDRIK